MKCPKGMLVDHVNRNMLDNRRSNLRICDHSVNCWNRKGNWKNNTSGFSGVWKRILKDEEIRWDAFIMIRGKRLRLGSFLNFKEEIFCSNSV